MQDETYRLVNAVFGKLDVGDEVIIWADPYGEIVEVAKVTLTSVTVLRQGQHYDFTWDVVQRVVR